MSEDKKLWSDERIAAALNKVDTNWFRGTTLYKAFGWLEAMRDEYEEQIAALRQAIAVLEQSALLADHAERQRLHN